MLGDGGRGVQQGAAVGVGMGAERAWGGAMGVTEEPGAARGGVAGRKRGAWPGAWLAPYLGGLAQAVADVLGQQRGHVVGQLRAQPRTLGHEPHGLAGQLHEAALVALRHGRDDAR